MSCILPARRYRRQRSDQGVEVDDEFGGGFELAVRGGIGVEKGGVVPVAVGFLLGGEPVAHADQPVEVGVVAGGEGEKSAAPGTLADLFGFELARGRFD